MQESRTFVFREIVQNGQVMFEHFRMPEDDEDYIQPFELLDPGEHLARLLGFDEA